jgi:hypothetical protein
MVYDPDPDQADLKSRIRIQINIYRIPDTAFDKPLQSIHNKVRVP